MLVGYFIVAAEPAVHVLKKQVEEISSGRITQTSIGIGLSIGVAVSVGIAMLRILTGIPLMWFMIPGYAISLLISFFVPPLYTGVAFDSGGVASGPMTTTFLLPFAVGACSAVGGNLLTDAFGIVAMVAMTPLITIQVIGLYAQMKHRAQRRRTADQLSRVDDGILYYDRNGG
jgi:membrane protein YdbS with pleckstrin-like domain